MWCCALHKQLSCCYQCCDFIANHALIVGVVTLAEVTDGQVAPDTICAVPWQVLAVTLLTEVDLVLLVQMRHKIYLFAEQIRQILCVFLGGNQTYGSILSVD